MNYSQNSSKGYIGDYLGSNVGVLKWDTTSLDYSSYESGSSLQGYGHVSGFSRLFSQAGFVHLSLFAYGLHAVIFVMATATAYKTAQHGFEAQTRKRNAKPWYFLQRSSSRWGNPSHNRVK